MGATTAHIWKKCFNSGNEAALKAMDDAGRQQVAEATATWLAELAVP
jgi:hypothetical protein